MLDFRKWTFEVGTNGRVERTSSTCKSCACFEAQPSRHVFVLAAPVPLVLPMNDVITDKLFLIRMNCKCDLNAMYWVNISWKWTQPIRFLSGSCGYWERYLYTHVYHSLSWKRLELPGRICPSRVNDTMRRKSVVYIQGEKSVCNVLHLIFTDTNRNEWVQHWSWSEIV